MMKFIRSIPMAICGVSLGLAALGNLLLLPFGPMVRYLCGILSAFVLLLFILKLVFDSSHALEELKTPVPLSVLTTATMSLMLLTTYVRPHLPGVALIVWYVAVCIHVGIMVLFFKRFVVGLTIANVFPSWFVAFVGIVTVSVTAPAMGAVPLGQVAFYVGFVLYFIAFPLVIRRMTKPGQAFPQPAIPTIAIFAAPMSLLVVGYFSSFQEKNETLVYFMLAIAIINYIYVLVKMATTMLAVRFYPTYAAFTFPFVISSIAFLLCADFLASREIFFLAPFAQFSQWVATFFVVYVIGHYVKYFRYWLQF